MVFANDRFAMPNYAGKAMLLAKVKGNRLSHVAVLVGAQASIWPGTKASDFYDCGIPGLFQGGLQGTDATRTNCWLVTSVFTKPWEQWADKSVKISSGLIRAAAGAMMARGITFPQDMMQVSFLHSETWGTLRVQYMFNPELEGLKGTEAGAITDTDWAPNNISKFPEKARYAAKLKAWGEAYLPLFNQAFENAGKLAQARS